MQRCGTKEVLKSFQQNEDIKLILIRRNSEDKALTRVRSMAVELGIDVIEGSDNDLWRMSRDNSQGTPDVLALVGRDPSLSFDDVIDSGGLVWVLAGAAYPVNIGFCIRTAEVSGADAVFVDAELSNTERKAAKRASMKAHRFIPVFWGDGLAAVKRAKEEGFRIISLEDVGQKTPWDTDLTGDTMIVVGGERNGIPKSILDISDVIIRVPMSGFVPSFNLQAPLSVVAVEAQRQRSN